MPFRFRPRARILALVAFMFGSLAACAQNQPVESDHAPRALHYEIRRSTEDPHALEVKLSWDAGTDTFTELRLPDQWAGQTALYAAIRNLRVDTPGAYLRPGTGPASRILDHPSHILLELRYEVVEEKYRNLAESEAYLRPIIERNSFHFIGEGFFVSPDWQISLPRLITLSWSGFPETAQLADSFGVREHEQRLNRSLADLRNAVFVGGDFTLLKTLVHGRPLWFALRGPRTGREARFVETATRLMEVERGLFRDYEYPFYLITGVPVAPNCCFSQGRGLIQSFAVFYSERYAIDSTLIQTLARGFFTHWTEHRIKYAEPASSLTWFTQGFSDYYARLLALRAKLLDPPGYVDQYNEVIRRYLASPARTQPNGRIMTAGESDPELWKLARWRGDLLAHRWNARIRATHADRSLDDFMRLVLRNSAEQSVLLTEAAIRAWMGPIMEGGADGDLQSLIDRGDLLHPGPDDLGPCARLESRKLPAYDPGFDVNASEAEHVVIGVRPEGPAWMAGLRNGQTLVSLSISQDAGIQARVTLLQEDQSERAIQFLPRGVVEGIPQYGVDRQAYSRDPKACLAWLNATII